MSKIGLGNNINQPTKQCFSCKYWKAATKLSLLEITEPGFPLENLKCLREEVPTP